MTWRPERSMRGKPRPAYTYRGMRKNDERRERMSLYLRNERKAEERKADAPRSKWGKRGLGVHT